MALNENFNSLINMITWHVNGINSVMNSLSRFWKVFKKSITKFIDDNAIKLSASLSYYTIFALPPMLLIILHVSGIFFGREATQGEVYAQISGIVGPSVALSIQDIIKNVHLRQGSFILTSISIGTLVVVSTGMFAEMQDSINRIWGIKAKPRRSWLKWLANRLLSFSMIVTIGFLSLVSLILNTIIDILSAKLQAHFTHLTVTVVYILNIALMFSIIATLFTIIFKILPDGRVNWRDSWRGASFTTLLFMAGKFGIGYYLSHSSITTIYGAAGSIIAVLLWVYYSSIILYFGAEYTMLYACMFGKKVTPKDYAVFIEHREIESVKAPSLS
jgi:membrane protein